MGQLECVPGGSCGRRSGSGAQVLEEKHVVAWVPPCTLLAAVELDCIRRWAVRAAFSICRQKGRRLKYFVSTATRGSQHASQHQLTRSNTVEVKVSTRHGHLSEGTQAKIRAKVERLPRYFERLTAIEVTVDLEHKESPAVDLKVSAEHKHDFVAREQGADLMAAIDAVVHKVEQQLRKYKQRVQEHRGPGLRQKSQSESEAAGA